MKSFFCWICAIFFYTQITWAVDVPITMFPIEHYDQNVNVWLSPQDATYQNLLLSPEKQKNHMQNFLKQYFAPWDESWVFDTIASLNLEMTEKETLSAWKKPGSSDSIGYKQNFRSYGEAWFKAIEKNMALAQFSKINYNATHRAIIVKNTSLRVLPTHDPLFYRFDLPGEGYPFDMLQSEVLWIGLPTYVVGETQDKAWQFVILADVAGWVETDAVATVDSSFISRWDQVARHQLLAITKTETTLEDDTQQFLSKLYVGTVLPVIDITSNTWKIDVPFRDAHGSAHIRFGKIQKNDAVLMPLLATPQHFAQLFKTLQQRPYGWGGLNFYNDCSLELRNLFTPFGIALPYFSGHILNAGKSVDLTSQSPQERLNFLMQQGHPLMTVVHISGHVFLYLGNHPDPKNKQHTLMAMTYQNVWGLRYQHNNQSGRAVIGQSVFFPLLLAYPEDVTLTSHLANKQFEMVYLDK